MTSIEQQSSFYWLCLGGMSVFFIWFLSVIWVCELNECVCVCVCMLCMSTEHFSFYHKANRYEWQIIVYFLCTNVGFMWVQACECESWPISSTYIYMRCAYPHDYYVHIAVLWKIEQAWQCVIRNSLQNLCNKIPYHMVWRFSAPQAFAGILFMNTNLHTQTGGMISI